ncbi:MAG: neutral/alkaline non-lysosomal ceramidase N-terminal domain-containing protein, partial [Verrucomicrobiae bacterium]|nr:neutral/alkaline non-lysosomal ceramidase N-terminal domain-containing protein [Verrucomicrobiae bacterium]
MASLAQEPTAWKAGVASAKITPEGQVWMSGFAARKKPSEGVATDLFAKALVIEDPCGTRLVIVTMDLIVVPRSLRDWLAGELAKKHRLPPESLLINASHTHCGPELIGSALAKRMLNPEYAPAAENYTARLRQQLVSVVDEAFARISPVRLDLQRARCGFAMNRRRPTQTGFANAPHFDGPVDHDVPVLRVTSPEGKLVALVFGYACHTTTCNDYLIRGDYAGYAQQFLETSHPGCAALFIAGCGGDQNPYPRGTDELARTHGRSLALAVESALETPPRPLRGPLTVAFADVPLDLVVPGRAELERTAATRKEPHRSLAAELLEELRAKGEICSVVRCPVQVVRFGADLTLIALGGETCVDYSLRLKRELAGQAVWVAGYCNDVFGYLPSLRVLREGGYEGSSSTVWYSLPGPFKETVEERVVSKALEFARQPIESWPATVDLNIGQQTTVTLCNGKTATVKLLGVSEKRDSLRRAVRGAEVSVEVNGRTTTLNCATYHLPVTIGSVQIDCPLIKAYNEGGDHWGCLLYTS